MEVQGQSTEQILILLCRSIDWLDNKTRNTTFKHHFANVKQVEPEINQPNLVLCIQRKPDLNILSRMLQLILELVLF